MTFFVVVGTSVVGASTAIVGAIVVSAAVDVVNPKILHNKVCGYQYKNMKHIIIL